jgi:hypothetical protein
MIQIKREFTIDDFETSLQQTEKRNELLRVSHNIKSNATGSTASAIQLIVTWSRINQGSSTLRLHVEPHEETSLVAFAQSPIGLAAINMSEIILSRSGERIERRMLLEKSKTYVRDMHDGNLESLRSLNKTTIPLICVDNASSLRRPLRLYYPDSDTVLSRSYFEDLAWESFESILMTRGKLNRERDIPRIASLVYEAFLNTHEHAQNDAFGNRYRRSMRGVILSYQEVTKKRLDAMSPDQEFLRSYFLDYTLKNNNAIAQFAEISVLDAGPGLAENWLGKTGAISERIVSAPIDLEKEYDAVIQCLKKGGTTKGSSTRGNGLYRMLGVVRDYGGYIRIRSGRLSLVKVFGSATLDELSVEMQDLSTGLHPTKPRSWAEGTVITALIPLNRVAI